MLDIDVEKCGEQKLSFWTNILFLSIYAPIISFPRSNISGLVLRRCCRVPVVSLRGVFVLAQVCRSDSLQTPLEAFLLANFFILSLALTAQVRLEVDRRMLVESKISALQPHFLEKAVSRSLDFRQNFEVKRGFPYLLGGKTTRGKARRSSVLMT